MSESPLSNQNSFYIKSFFILSCFYQITKCAVTRPGRSTGFVRSEKAQISLGIPTAWSEPVLSSGTMILWVRPTLLSNWRYAQWCRPILSTHVLSAWLIIVRPNWVLLLFHQYLGHIETMVGWYWKAVCNKNPKIPAGGKGKSFP